MYGFRDEMYRFKDEMYTLKSSVDSNFSQIQAWNGLKPDLLPSNHFQGILSPFLNLSSLGCGNCTRVTRRSLGIKNYTQIDK